MLAALGGASIAVSFLDFSFWPLAWIAFAPIVIAISRAGSMRKAASVGLVAGLATNIPAFYWLVGTIHGFGGFPFWLSALFYLALSLYSAVEFSLFAIAVQLAGLGPLALYPAFFWVVLEFFYPNLFPWRMANCQLHLPALLQVGELTGPYGLSLVMVWTSTAVAIAFTRGIRRARASLLACAAAIASVIVYGIVRIPAVDDAIAAAPVVRVGIVQGDLSIEQKGDVRFLEGNLAVYRDLTLKLAADADVVIWPESVITQPLPRTLRQLPEGARATLGLKRPLLTGALTYEGSPEKPRFYNSIVLFGADGRLLGMSDKQILMPFGEYLPLGSLFPSLKELSPETGDFQAGTGGPLDVLGVARFAPLNCYEDLRSAIARHAVYSGHGEVLFAVANDAWFGNSPAPFQHEALALWRAVENRRFLVRVTNTGVTDVIDPAGRVRLRLPIFEPSSALAEVRSLRFESVYTRWGDWFAWLVSAFAATALLISARSPVRSALPNRPRPPS